MGDVVRKIRDTRMKVLFVGLLVVSSLAAFYLVATVYGLGLIGLWAALGVAGGFGVALTMIYRRIRCIRLPRASLNPGAVPCPECNSLQTDQVEEDRGGGRIGTVWVCFWCEHRWNVSDD